MMASVPHGSLSLSRCPRIHYNLHKPLERLTWQFNIPIYREASPLFSTDGCRVKTERIFDKWIGNLTPHLEGVAFWRPFIRFFFFQVMPSAWEIILHVDSSFLGQAIKSRHQPEEVTCSFGNEWHKRHQAWHKHLEGPGSQFLTSSETHLLFLSHFRTQNELFSYKRTVVPLRNTATLHSWLRIIPKLKACLRASWTGMVYACSLKTL